MMTRSIFLLGLLFLNFEGSTPAVDPIQVMGARSSKQQAPVVLCASRRRSSKPVRLHDFDRNGVPHIVTIWHTDC